MQWSLTFHLCFFSYQGRGERAYDIYSRLLRERIVCVMGPVSDSGALWRHLAVSPNFLPLSSSVPHPARSSLVTS